MLIKVLVEKGEAVTKYPMETKHSMNNRDKTRKQADVKKLLMVVVRLVSIYIGVLTIAALFTPWVHAAINSFWPNVSVGRVFDRLRYVGLIAMLPWVWNWTGLRHWTQLGWHGWKQGLMWMLAGALTVCAVGGIISWGSVAPQGLGLERLMILVLQGAGIGLAVALLEEVVFRGIFQNILTRAGGVVAGVMLASLLYAWLHGRPEGTEHSWELAWAHLSQWPANLPPMMILNLTLLGVALGMMYAKTRSLWVSIGLHAGVVAAAVPVVALLQNVDPMMNRQYLVASPVTTCALAGWAVLGLLWRARPVNGDADAEKKA